MPAPARFHALRDRALAAVDRVFAEPVKLSFMRDGVVDPSRSAVVIEAPLRTGASKNTGAAGAGAARQNWRGQVAPQKAELHVDPTKHPNLVIRTGDRVQALTRPGAPWWEVLAGDDRGMTRRIIHLGEI